MLDDRSHNPLHSDTSARVEVSTSDPALTRSPLEELTSPRVDCSTSNNPYVSPQVSPQQYGPRKNSPLAESPIISGLDYGLKYGAVFGGGFALMAAFTENTAGIRGQWTQGNPLEVGLAIFCICVVTGAIAGMTSSKRPS